MKVFTIGFTKKSAEQFFDTLTKNGITRLMDIRLNNKSQLAAFAKEEDLRYFLKKICAIEYRHIPQCAPSEELLKKYQNKEIDWPGYEKEYKALINKRNVVSLFNKDNLANSCFLCSEPTPEQCHRRLLVEYLKDHFSDIEIVHI
ncbi:MAG: DUF488 domain-containing protein [Methanomicrobiales archaeon]|nr:DUF488 domain-containing protein [Methanomicrobiales archaeon]